ncbi:MAG: hypothetical protein SWZ49_10475 [Cyanobacteriota bacterium]|nr:hypothetical protein [Cyanobacteriota bacterium]
MFVREFCIVVFLKKEVGAIIDDILFVIPITVILPKVFNLREINLEKLKGDEKLRFGNGTLIVLLTKDIYIKTAETLRAQRKEVKRNRSL